MKKALLIMLAIVLATAFGMTQDFGSVSGTVYDAEDNPVADANICLTGAEVYNTVSGEDGTFAIAEVLVGEYNAVAGAMGFGHDFEEIEVLAGEDTGITFVLEMGGHGGGGHHGGGHGHGQHDSLVVVELSGTAIVEVDEFYTHYFLDTNDDQEADYRLGFGPEWYDPGNGATRPEDGDQIDIVGGLMGYSEPQMVVVYEINGLFWREPGEGHGGHGGHGGGGGCEPDSLDLIEVSGFAIVEDMPHMDLYFMDEDNDTVEDYKLNFGAPWYDPGNGATRPEDGDEIDIVGGLMDGCDDWPVIIVYEINGMFWRDPGDTSALWFSPTSVEDNDGVAIPKTAVNSSSYPNPFNASAIISFDLPEAGQVKVTVYDLLGKEVAVLANGFYSAGRSQVVFDSSNLDNAGTAMYFYRIESEIGNASGKMLLLK